MSTDDARSTVFCLSPLELDEWIAGDDDAATHAARAAHVAQCAACTERAAEARRLAAEFLESAPSFGALTGEVRARRARSTRLGLRRTVSIATGMLAAAAAVLLMWGPHPEPPDPSVRSKGGPQLGVLIKRGAHVVRGGSGDVVHPGDVLRFDYTSSREGYLAVWGDDGRKRSLYHPWRGERAAPIAAGRNVALDFGVELDEALGFERFYGVFCSEAALLEPMSALLAGPAPKPPVGCTLETIVLRKEPAR